MHTRSSTASKGRLLGQNGSGENYGTSNKRHALSCRTPRPERPLCAAMYSALGGHVCFSGVVPLIEPAWRLSRDLFPIL